MKTLALLLVVLGSIPAAAAAPARVKIAILDLKVTGEIPPARVAGLGSLLASELSRDSRLGVITADDVRALVGLERQKEMLGCGDASCLAEIGGALGADYVLSPEVSRVGTTYLFSASVVAIKTASPVKRLSRPAKSEDGLVSEVQAAVPELLAALPELAGAPDSTPAPAPAVAVAAPSPAGGSSLPAWLCIGGGAVAAGVGGYLYAGALGVQTEYDEQQAKGTPATIWIEDAEDAELDAAIGLGLVGGGVALGVLGFFLFPDDAPPPVALQLSGGGAGLAWTQP